MDLDRIKSAWQSRANTPGPADAHQLVRQFAAGLRRERRRFIVFIVWVIAALTCFTAIAVYSLVVRGNVHLQQEWALLPALAVPWVFAVIFLRQFLQHRRAHPGSGDAILASIRAALDSNRLARSRIKRLVWVYSFGLPAIAVAMYQLHQTDKASPNEIGSMATVFTFAIAAAAVCAVWHYHRALLPQKSELESLLAQYNAHDPA